MSTTTATTRRSPQVDVRGPRFAAWITTAVLVVVLVVASVSTTVAGVLLAVQTVVFAAGAVFWWALGSGQYEDLEGPAHRILADETPVDVDQVPRRPAD